MQIVVCKAKMDDVPAVQHIARLCADGVGFVRRVALERAQMAGELYVARLVDAGNNLVIGFCIAIT